MCRQNILLTLLLTFTLFCQGQPLVDFSDPLETITHVRNGKIQLKSQKKEQIRFPSCGIFLPQFHKGEIGLDISGITPYSKVPAFSAVIHDRNGRSFRFLLKESSRENGRIRIPFSALPGLGETAARNIVEVRGSGEVLSQAELQVKAGLSKTVMELLRQNGVLDGMSETNQITLF